MEHELIAAPATPFGTAALAVIRTSGDTCIETLAPLVRGPERLLNAAGNTLVYANLLDPESGVVLDEVVLGVYRAPHSYTGEPMVEIFCHGSSAGVQRILGALYHSGFRPADPGEFTLRAFLAGKLDLTRAEAVHEVVQAQTGRAHEMALDRLSGTVEAEINAIKHALVRVSATIAVQIDYPEDDTGEIPFPLETVTDATRRLQALSESYRTGRLYQEGVRVAIAGRPNAGKSSLFNHFLRQDRSIVSETPGTTRDYIESALDLQGIPARIFDTAGLRQTEESVEGEGIARTTRVVEQADLVLYLIDGTVGVDREDANWLERPDLKARIIPVWTKTDLPGCQDAPAGFLPLSIRAATGFAELTGIMFERITSGSGGAGSGAVIIDSQRQKNLIDRALEALREVIRGVQDGMPVDAISLDAGEALRALGEITGEVTSADILDEVFGTFCLGK